MKHLGDITKIKGCSVPTVDCIIGGSPCQDLSVAGKRAGLAGERSGLYMEQIRIIKEMRHEDEQRGRTGESIRPRYMVWENVPGAFSSNQGKDFAAVLEEAIKVADPKAPDVLVPEKGWPTSGCIYDEMGKWSVAWRVMDAQYWGVPQRRRRICLVADFNGLNAPKIVFGEAEYNGSTECAGGKPSVGHTGAKSRSKVQPLAQGVSRDIDESEQERKATARDVKNRSGADDRDGESNCLAFHLLQDPIPNSNIFPCMGQGNSDRGQASIGVAYVIHEQPVCIGFDAYNQAHTGEVSKPLTAAATYSDHTPIVFQPVTFEPGIASREGGHIYEGVSGTLRAKAGDNQMSVAYATEKYLFENHSQDSRYKGPLEVSPMLSAQLGTGGNNTPLVMESVGFEMQAFGKYKDSGIASSLKARDYKDATDLVVAGPVYGDCYSMKSIARNGKVLTDQANPICSCDYKDPDIVCYAQSVADPIVWTGTRYIVRRLTPLECERLQGFPDGWTDIGEWVDSKGKKHKEADSPRYKALGNSIALPPWKWVLKRLCACYERDATMASLFSGIGGFDLIWTQLNGWGSVLWESEIEDFPSAVCKRHFGDEETGEKGDLYEILFGRNKTENV